MRVMIFCDQVHIRSFLQAGERLGHAVCCVTADPTAEEAAAFCPDAVILQVRGPASGLQDLLIDLYEACAKAPRLLLFECRDGICFCAETRAGDGRLAELCRSAMGRVLPLCYPDQNWQERFPQAFTGLQRREATKTMLYGVTREEFLQ